METKKIVVFGFGQRGRGYANFAKNNPDKFDVIAIIETDAGRREIAESLLK